MHKVLISGDPVRVFKKQSGTSKQLCRVGLQIRPGTQIVVDEQQTLIYDHRDQRAVRVVEGYGKGEYYVLVEELGCPSLTQ